MIISWNWLNRYASLSDLDPTSAAHRFTVTTAEIEEVIAPPSRDFLSQFLVAEVRSVEAHPNADKLRCCKVFNGETELSIVCGAANVREGLLTVLAPIGCDFGDFKIKKSKLRGELSEGMLCSEKELGVGTDDEGIAELDGSYRAGQTVDAVFDQLGVQWDLDNKAITHRPDLWGHYGLAREAGAVFKKEVQQLELDALDAQGHDGFDVKINKPELCRRYCGLSLTGVRVQPSPKWMQDLLKEVGQTPINNVVDATNFVMLELGQPTHAFDQKKLSSKKLCVDTAQNKESFETLTGKSIELSSEDLVIRSGDEVVALAGVVGGEHSSISETTTEIFLESAHFMPLCVRKTAKTYDLRTDASARFEKSLDPEHAPMAIARLVHLLKETCPELQLKSGLIDVFPSPIATRVIELNPELVERKMGFEIPASEQLEIFDRLGFAVDASDQPWKVTVPTYRNTKDIEEPIDLVEELGRVAGYDRIVPSSPQLSLDAKPPREAHTKNRVLQDGLVSMGYSEVKSYSFASEQELIDLDWLPRAMKLANPMSKDQAYMRPGLLVRQMEIWALNAKNLEAFAMFEMGVVFERRSDRQLPDERLELCLSRYGESDQGEDLYQLKADVTCALEAMGVDGLTWSKAEDVHVCAHPARVGVLRVNGEVCGTIAELHPARAKKLGLKKRITFAVIDAPMALPTRENIKYQGLDRFPAVPFSCSFIVDARTTAGEVMACIQSADAALIQDLKWMGNYSGASTPEGKISMTFAMNFRRSDRTMNADEIQSLQSTIIEKAKAQNFNLRES